MMIMLIFCASAISGILVEAVVQPVVNIISFTTLQTTSLGIGVVASYFVDLYPTSCSERLERFLKMRESTKVENINGSDVYSYDEAVELTGHGRYNYLCLLACCVISNAVAIDMFGLGVIVAAASCDLQLGMTETGILASAPFAGLLFAFSWGYFADTRGRRLALLISTSVGFVFAALSSFSPSWHVMLAFKLIGCSFSTAAFTLTMTYLGECTGNKYRSEYLLIMNSINLASELVVFVLAYFILPLDFKIVIPWLSIVYKPWRLLTFIMAVFLGLGSLMMYYLYESPKFLANKGECAKALDVLSKIYECNGGKSHEYPVKGVASKEVNCNSEDKFWVSLVKQTVPIFKPPLLWRTLQLFYVMSVCCSTNNVFFMWFPKMINSFFVSFYEGVNENKSFCERVIGNITLNTDKPICNDKISDNTIYSGILYGLFFMVATLIVSKMASWRKILLIAIFLVSAVSGVLVDSVKQPAVNVIAFTLLQSTSISIGIVASYFVDLYQTSYRGLVASLGMMVARLASLAGVNIVGALIIDHCSWTFYSWSIFVTSGIVVAFFLPSDREMKRK